MGDSINPFAVLGVDETATRTEIDAAYRARVRQLHPDTLGDVSAEARAAAESAMADVTLAHGLLTDERTRVAYQRAQEQRRAAAARRGEMLPRHPSQDVVVQDDTPSPGVSTPTATADYREAARAEFVVRDRKTGTPWVASPRRSPRLFRRAR